MKDTGTNREWAQFLPAAARMQAANEDAEAGRPKMYVVGTSYGYARPWLPLFELTDDAAKADCALFTGGSDISPDLYGDMNVRSYPWPARDAEEVPMYRKFRARGVPIIGICRGAQLACALEGGKLYQHVERHAGGMHPMQTHDGNDFAVSSLHHQMMRPAGDFELHGWCNPRSREYLFADAEGKVGKHAKEPGEMKVDPEVVWWPKAKVYGIQGHPEMLHDNEPVNVWFRDQVSHLILGSK